MLNRAALIVRPREPYLAWARSLDESGLVPSSDGEKTVYLVPSISLEQNDDEVLKQVYAEIFERELFGWHTDESAWPKSRTLATFKKWFTYEFHTIVEDLCSYPIEPDDDDA